MIIVDSGLGGLSVARALRAAGPDLPLCYLADTAGFPYGSRTPENINARAHALIRAASETVGADVYVLACNTLSTLCLKPLRDKFDYNFVGTVPAIKVAAEQSKTRRFTLLATPNTAHSAYSNALIEEFASDCVVDTFGAPHLASYAERMLLGEPIDEGMLRAEIAPCFHDDARGKTDSIILGCTHYPLILSALESLAPWPVQWIDSSTAIARRALSQRGAEDCHSIAYVTAADDVARYRDLFAREGFAETRLLSLAA